MSFPRNVEGLEHEIREEEVTVGSTTGGDPDSVFVRGGSLWRIGECLWRLKRYDEAAQRLADADAELSKLPEARLLVLHSRTTRALALISAGRPEEALESIERALADADANSPVPGEYEFSDMTPNALSVRALLLDQLGQYEAAYTAAEVAVEWYESRASLELRPQRATALVVQGKVAQRRGDNGLAVAKYQQAARLTYGIDHLHTPRWEALYGLAASLEADGRTEEALNAYDSFLREFGHASDGAILAALRTAMQHRRSLSEPGRRRWRLKR